MRCKLEENSRLFDVLHALRKGYETGDFSKLFPYLAADCVMESQWVFSPNTGYDAIVEYFTEKGKTLAKTDSFPYCSIVELIGSINSIKSDGVRINEQDPMQGTIGLLYTHGKLCLLMEQTLDGETYGVIVDVQLANDGMVKRIDLCMPELFEYRDCHTFVEFLPASEDDENESALVRVSEPYYSELYLFMACAGEDFDENDDLHIPMRVWIEALNYWKSFANAETYDKAFEFLAGINYDTGVVGKPDAAKRFGRSEKRMWDERWENYQMLANLLEWTESYKDSYSFINTRGWRGGDYDEYQ
ncbi:MAG: hypothetical protein Q4E17_05335 [Synergistes sp.]|nr:hypothetical protein [Synergistes sp.]